MTAAAVLLDACVEKPLALGHDIMERVSDGTQGVQEKVRELENRRQHVNQLYTQRSADAVHSSERAVNFLSQCNSVSISKDPCKYWDCDLTGYAVISDVYLVHRGGADVS